MIQTMSMQFICYNLITVMIQTTVI